MKNLRIGEKTPWAWVPTLYFAEGIPYVIVMTIAVVMYSRLGLSNAEVALYTGWLYLPWVIKPLWSPIVDIFKTKRWWIILMQFFAGAGLAGVAFTIEAPNFVQWTLAFFWLVAFSSATHDIAADGFYMLALDSYKQSLFVGIRSTFYRIATIAGQGLVLMLAGNLETYLHSTPRAWYITLAIVAFGFLAFAIWHVLVLPRPASDHATTGGDGPLGQPTLMQIVINFGRTFITFLKKRHIVVSILFLLLYRFPEAFLVKISPLFLLDKKENGGLFLSTAEIGFATGTIGIIGLTIGGILGGIITTRGGLKKWLWPMVWSITLPDLVYVLLSFYQPDSLFLISSCIFVEQFGYGFGFTAYMLYMLYFSQGESQTSHYAICTAFMAASMMLPGMFAGMLQEAMGYRNFFIFVMGCCLVTIAVSALVKIDPSFGIKKKKEE